MRRGPFSALARARNLLAYSETPPDLAALAAAYAYGITKNHPPFIDGSKRTALVVWRTFLLLNHRDIDATPEEKCVPFLRLAAGAVSEGDLAQWIRDRLMIRSVD